MLEWERIAGETHVLILVSPPRTGKSTWLVSMEAKWGQMQMISPRHWPSEPLSVHRFDWESHQEIAIDDLSNWSGSGLAGQIEQAEREAVEHGKLLILTMQNHASFLNRKIHLSTDPLFMLLGAPTLLECKGGCWSVAAEEVLPRLRVARERKNLLNGAGLPVQIPTGKRL